MNLIKQLARTVGVTLKHLYDIFATYLLFWVLYVAAIAVALHFGEAWIWTYLGVENPELVWSEMAARTVLDVHATRLLFLVGLHLAIFVVLRRPIAVVQPAFERVFDGIVKFFVRLTSERPSVRLFGESVFTVVISALLIPFIMQPTLVRGWDAEAWLERGENLVSGRAVLDLPESVIGYYRRFGAETVIVEEGVNAEELHSAFEEAEEDSQEPAATLDEEIVVVGVDRPWGGAPKTPQRIEVAVQTSPRPVMDRWDDNIRDAVQHSDELFPYVKAFMYVESGGRQYAVSRTGCAGLMQFCAGTAKSQPYREVFGTGQVYACGCRGSSCAVSKATQVELESGVQSRVDAQEANFPCEMTDARFNPDRALEAGGLYIKRLHDAFDGNIYLMYIGYNSGPGVAKRVLRSLGNDPHATIQEIEVHLTAALQPYYGAGSARRARSLTRVHLPKIHRALVRYGGPAEAEMLKQDQQQLPEDASALNSAGAQSNPPK